MEFFRKRYGWIFSLVFLGFIFLLSFLPPFNQDTFFHVKAGEILLRYGIIHRDIFSYTAYGREWFPYEWLFQVGMYLWQKAFGFAGISYLVSLLATLQVAMVLGIGRYIFRVKRLWSFFLSFLFFAWTIEFYYPRPQLFAVVCFSVIVFLLLLYIRKNINLLWLSLPISLVWTNMHGSIIFAVYLWVAYAGLFWIFFFLNRQKECSTKARVMSLYAILTILITILPPLGTLQYRLDFIFLQKSSMITQFIAEWKPIYRYIPILFLAFLAVLGITYIATSVLVIRKHLYKQILWALPLLPFTLLPFLSFRHTPYSYLILTILLFFCVSSLQDISFSKVQKWGGYIGMACLFGVHLFLIHDFTTASPTSVVYPVKAVDFIAQHHLQGHMFNEFDMGAYLIYRLYPQYKVFGDLRADVYLCCEIPAYQMLTPSAPLSDSAYKKRLDHFLQTYDISYMLISTRQYILPQEINLLLRIDPHWKRVYWDDSYQIFVKDDGKNNALIQTYSASVATPYAPQPFIGTDYEKARSEYERMITVVDSARSENALGYIDLKEKNLTDAQERFEKAMQLDPDFDSPYLNLGEIMVSQGDYQTAIALYQKAENLNPGRAFIYLRLAQLYNNFAKDPQSAQQTLQQGLMQVANDTDRKTISQALQALGQ